MNSPVILIIGEDRGLCQNLIGALTFLHGKIIETPSQSSSLRLIRERNPEIVIIVSSADNQYDKLDLVIRIRQQSEKIPILFFARYSSEERAISAFRAGVSDYFRSPFILEEAVNRINSLIGCSSPRMPPEDPAMIGRSRSMREINSYIKQIASTGSTVFLTGETGTGKGLAAALIHRLSARGNKPLITVNCAALPDTLVESELFGYEKGAFTGAVIRQPGKFEAANEGTIFLDEIGDMCPYAQAKILKTIEDKEIYRLGGRISIPLNIRLIAATNRNPEELIAKKELRKDLYYRLNVARVHLPPLRDRKEDIPRLVAHCIQELNRRFNRHVECCSEDSMNALLQYDWPGNVRELKNLLEVAFIKVSSKQISMLHFPEEFFFRINPQKDVKENEKEKMLSTLVATNWNKSEAARKLKCSRMTLYRKISKYHLENNNPSRMIA